MMAELSHSRTRTGDRALLIGIPHYADRELSSLPGVSRDLDELSRVLGKHSDGRPNFEVTSLLSTEDESITTEKLLEELDLILDGLEETDHFVFYFSGHGLLGNFGFQLATAEKSGAFDGGIHFEVLLTRFNRLRCAVTVILDCCYSGAAGDQIVHDIDGRRLLMTHIREDVTILASSRRDQRSFIEEDEDLSEYTAAIVAALDNQEAMDPGTEIDALMVHSFARSRLLGQMPVVRFFGGEQHHLRRL
jgi:uncharacterized caspase-like protein